MSALVQHLAPGLDRMSLRTPTLPPATETNSYFVEHEGAFLLVEPATPHAPERAELFREVRRRIAEGRRLEGALLTHHHVDHVGAANAFRDEFRAPVMAHAITRERLRENVEVDRTVDESDRLLGGAVSLLLTPGHAPGHLCVHHRARGWLIAGDMIASVGTIVIDVDDGGDMADYLAQIARLRDLGARQLLPAHGDPIENASARLEFYLAHRAQREAKIVDAVTALGGAAELGAIVARAYDDTPPLIWPLAARSARAHLVKLSNEGVVAREGDRWRRR